MLSALLCSGNLRNYTVLGQDGIAVYSVASQLRNTIKLKRGKIFADYLAIPQINEQGSQIDWYVPFDSTSPDGKYFIIPWSAATDEERAQAWSELQVFERSMLELGQEIGSVNEIKGDQRLFARLLCSTGSNDVGHSANLTALRFPSVDCVYIVNGRPVITFWGFSEKNTTITGSPFLPLRPVISATETTFQPTQAISQTVPIVEKHNKCKRFWWILPLLLALALLLFFLRGCAPSLGLPSLGLPSLSLPSLGLPSFGSSDSKASQPELNNKKEPILDPSLEPSFIDKIPEFSKMFNGQKFSFLNGKWFDDKGNEVTDGTLFDGLNSALTATNNEVGEQNLLKEVDPKEIKSEEVKPDQSKLKPIESEVKEVKDDAVGVNNQLIPNPDITKQEASNKLNIPANSLTNGGNVDFLNGSWNAGAGIQDETTGKPLRLNYQFNNGTGKVRLNRGDGVECVGDVSAAMNNGGLNINNTGTAKCSDGTSYKLPQVRCNGSGGDTDCKGEYQQGNSFPMSIKN